MIPDFDIHGVVPPIRPGEAGHSPERAPYPTTMLRLCQRFGGSVERRAILSGLLSFRAALHDVGIVQGFQWINGSFSEDVERLRGRSPADVDVVTFAALGEVTEQRERIQHAPALFRHAEVKSTYLVDHYLVQTDDPYDHSRAKLAQHAAYWYSMWAHQRDTARWKGFVSVPLQSDDDQALAWLAQHAAVPGEEE